MVGSFANCQRARDYSVVRSARDGFAAAQRTDDEPVDAEFEGLVLVQWPERPQHVLDLAVDPRVPGPQRVDARLHVLRERLRGS